MSTKILTVCFLHITVLVNFLYMVLNFFFKNYLDIIWFILVQDIEEVQEILVLGGHRLLLPVPVGLLSCTPCTKYFSMFYFPELSKSIYAFTNESLLLEKINFDFLQILFRSTQRNY